MSSNTKLTSESAKELLEFDSDVWGAGVYKIKKKYYGYLCIGENSEEVIDQEKASILCSDILSLYNALKKASHFHPVIEILRRDAEVIVKRLYDEIPKEDWKPKSVLEQIAYDYLFQKNHEIPTEKDVINHINKIKGGLPK